MIFGAKTYLNLRTLETRKLEYPQQQEKQLPRWVSILLLSSLIAAVSAFVSDPEKVQLF